MFAKSYGIIVLYLSGTQDVSNVWTDILPLECIFAETLTKSVAFILVNKFETYWEITPDGSVLFDLAPWTQIK